MDFIDRIKKNWEILVKPYPIQSGSAHYASLDSINPVESPSKYSVESPPTLQELIQEIGPVPPYSIIIGGCDDHSHLFMDLSDPAPGSILIAGDDRSGRSRLLESILYSSTMLNSPRRVRYAIIAPDVTGMEYLTQLPHCYKTHTVDSSEAIDLIYELADITEYRWKNQNTGSAIILAVDDLACLLSDMDENMVEQFRWLVQFGPQMQIWTMVTLNTKDVSTIDPAFLNLFGTRLIGSTESPEVVNFLSGTSENKPTEGIPGAQFSVQFNKDWIRFWIPAVEELVS